MSNTLKDKVAIIFARYTEAKEFHFTADGQAFSLETDAKNHANTLEDKTVRKITRKMVKAGDIYGAPAKPKEAGKDSEKGVKNEFLKEKADEGTEDEETKGLRDQDVNNQSNAKK